MNIIGHIDADCFYVSCERVRDPRLKGKPVGVLSNQGACVIAKSYELKPFGVTVGMPVWKAKKVCPEAIYIKRDFQWYGVLSKAMYEIFKSYSDVVEYYSIDESFVNFGDYQGDWDKLGKEIQEKVLRGVGLPVSVGISLSRTLAKIASKKGKPFGVITVDKVGLDDFLKNTNIREIPGIGSKLKRRLTPYGIETAWDYTQMPSFFIKKLVHKPGEELWYELKGKALLPIRSERPARKGVSRGGSLWGHHQDFNYIWAFLVRNLERFADALWKQEMEILNLIVILMTSDGRFLKQVEPLPDYTYSYNLLLGALRAGFEKLYVGGVSYCASHLIGDPVRSRKKKQLSMFRVEGDSDDKLVELKKELNKKFGVFTVRGAATAYAPDVFKDEASHFEISDIDSKFCF